MEGLDRQMDSILLPDGMHAEAWSNENLRGQWLRGKATKGRRVLLYLHGGGYQYGSSRSHRHLAGAIAQAAACDSLVLDYRLAPEHPFSAALDDAVAAYAMLLENHSPCCVAIAGDSAGGGLAIATLIAARERGLPMPAAIVCMSPWADLTCPEPSPHEMARIDDPISPIKDMRDYANAYLADEPADNPLASPVFASLDGLPPMFLQTGSGEILLRDSIALVNATRASSVTFEIEGGAPHVWQWFWPRLASARRSLARIGRFLDEKLD